MRQRHVLNLFLVLLLGCISTVSYAQPRAVKKRTPESVSTNTSKKELRKGKRALKRSERVNLEIKHVVLFEGSRLASSRFPSLTFTYQHLFEEWYAVVGSLGVPLNQLPVYRELTGPLSGIEARLGGRVYARKYQGSRFFFSLDGWITHNPVKANAFARETGRASYRTRALKLKRKRQMIVPSFGFQAIALNGLTIDLQLGIVAGRRGIFSEGGVDYLSSRDNDFFSFNTISKNTWAPYVDARFGLMLGYAF